jgi:methionyl-tRNA formyltransferase
LARRVRAFDPFPGCTWSLNGEVVKVWQAQAVAGQGQPGQVLAADAQRGDFTVACGEGALRLQVLQRTGGRRLPAADFLRGWPLAVGTTLG